MKYLITGGNKLSGKIHISGNKNAILPCMAASLLTDEAVILKNVPNISDVEVMIKILSSLGVEVKREEDTLILEASKVPTSQLPDEFVSKLRASILLAG